MDRAEERNGGWNNIASTQRGDRAKNREGERYRFLSRIHGADTFYLDTGKSPALPLCKRTEGEGIIDLKKRARRETLTTLLAAAFTAMHWSFEGVMDTFCLRNEKKRKKGRKGEKITVENKRKEKNISSSGSEIISKGEMLASKFPRFFHFFLLLFGTKRCHDC